MAKDDYHVILYQILSYLYQCLKNGTSAKACDLQHNSKLFQINRNYWMYIIYHMQTSGMIEGISFIEIDGSDFPLPAELEKCRITPVGIEYLCDNSLMKKVKDFMKDVKDITPFI